jgi:hypothetical protein
MAADADSVVREAIQPEMVSGVWSGKIPELFASDAVQALLLSLYGIGLT